MARPALLPLSLAVRGVRTVFCSPLGRHASIGRAGPVSFFRSSRVPLNPVVVIPARLASTRLPDKPLSEIHGRPMIVHVWERAVAAGIGPVIVACAEAAIADAVRAAGGEAVLDRKSTRLNSSH